jgi:hypothetical protein
LADFGCDNCNMLKGKHCKLWQVEVIDPHNSHCESGQHFGYKSEIKEEAKA